MLIQKKNSKYSEHHSGLVEVEASSNWYDDDLLITSIVG